MKANRRNSLQTAGVALAFIAILLAVVLPSFVSKDDPANVTVKLQPVLTKIQAPTAMAFPGNGDVWVTEQSGKIKLLKNGVLNATPVLDLAGKIVRITPNYDERGLLGVALHPDFKTNKKFYVFYSGPADAGSQANHKDMVAEYTLLPNTDRADPASERIVWSVDKPAMNHNGGCIQFGPDGYLYISLGDGGGQHDQHGTIGNGQNLNAFLGKILRIDVNAPKGYLIPKDNPFVGRTDAKPEIWCYGLRNPYRFSFDKASRQLFIGDVGQDNWEEVDIAVKGANYGWRLVEGNHCHNPATGCAFTGITPPIAEYSHREGITVIGGFVYNGTQITSLKGKYVFADWTGPTWYLEKAGDKWLRGKIEMKDFPANAKITGFGEDTSGELYVLTNADTGPGFPGSTTGGVYKLVK